MARQGDRVGAILRATDSTVYFLGFGVYEADEVPDENASGLAPLVREMGRLNPKIRLDDGSVVWGAECWWGSEEAIRETLKEYVNVVHVNIDNEREQRRKIMEGK